MNSENAESKHVIIIGAGPAGLAAGYEFVRQGLKPVILEKADKIGGIARTEIYKDYYFDIGGHRFFTKIEKIDNLWQEMMGKEFLSVPRLSRIFYGEKFFYYPLRLNNVLSNLGIMESFLILVSYISSRLKPHTEEDTFEHWVSNRFGERLYNMFFKSYTEKVWGIPCNKIRAEWAAQRIRKLSLVSALLNAVFRIRRGSNSLISRFHYPPKGPGMMWERIRKAVEKYGGEIRLNSDVISLKHNKKHITDIIFSQNGNIEEFNLEHLISSIPITKLVQLLDPQPPPYVLEAALGLSYRAFIIVMLILDKKEIFPDQWIYIHTPEVRVGRIQNFKNWSPAMVPDLQKTSIGMEYFCNAGDDLWQMPDKKLSVLAAGELVHLQMADYSDVIDSFVVRQPCAYPVYDKGYEGHLGVIRDYIEKFDNLQSIGRSGMHRYNNMDHSMLTGILAVENYFGKKHNLWAVNEDDEYLEEKNPKGF